MRAAAEAVAVAVDGATASWALSAALLTLLAAPQLIRLGRRIGCTAAPTWFQSDAHEPPAALGGVPVVVAVVAAALFGHAGRGVIALAAGACLLVGIRSVAALRTWSDALSLGAPAVVGVAAISLGFAAPLSIAGGAVAVLVVTAGAWTTASFEQSDGMPAAVLALTAATLAVVLHLDNQPGAAMAAALCGALCGLLPYNVRPTVLLLGPGGSQAAGLLVGGLAFAAAARPERFDAVLLLPLALPVLDAATTESDRWRSARPPGRAPGNHIWQRLVANGCSPFAAGIALFATQALVCGSTLLWRSGDQTVAAVVAAGSLLALTVAARRPVGDSPGRTLRLVRVLPATLVGVLALVIGGAALSLWAASGSARQGLASARSAVAAAQKGDLRGAETQLGDARRSFGETRSRLANPAVWAASYLPLVGDNVEAVTTLAAAGRDLAGAGERLTARADPTLLDLRGRRVDLTELAALSVELDATARTAQRASVRLDGLRQDRLVGPLRRATREASDRIGTAADGLRKGSAIADVGPALLGGRGPRRYLVVFQNNAEARATGGMVLSFAELSIADGSLELGDVRRVLELNLAGGAKVLNAPADYRARYAFADVAYHWQNINLTPDFPTAAAVMADQYRQAGFGEVDGVIAIDPFVLAALLRFTGPISVAAWPEPITADNVVELTLHRAYVEFESGEQRRTSERVDFLDDVAAATWAAVGTSSAGSPTALATTFGPLVSGKHVQVWSIDDVEQAALAVAGVAGQLKAVTGDSIMVTTQNAAANKIDWFLHRRLRYRATARPDPTGKSATVAADLELTLDNRAAASGLPPYIIGPDDPRFKAGQNYTYLSVYSPLELASASIDGQPIELSRQREHDRYVYSTFLLLQPLSETTVHLELAGRIALDNGMLTLDVLRQGLLWPDDIDIEVELGSGWSFADGRTARHVSDQPSEDLRIQEPLRPSAS